MSLTYQEFKDHVVTFLWKQNDTQLINSFDTLVAMADAHISRVLKINNREVTADLVATGFSVPVPADFKQLVELTDENNTIYTAATVTNLAAIRRANISAPNPQQTFFRLSNKVLELSQEYSATQPLTLKLTYRPSIPDYKTTDASWVADDYLDWYTYAVLDHTAPFLREDERSALWASRLSSIEQSILEENAFEVDFGTTLKMPLPYK